MRALKLTFIAAAAALVLAAFALIPQRLCFEGAERYKFFSGDTSKNCIETDGGKFPVFKRLTLTNVCGETAYYSELDLDGFLRKVGGEIVFTEEFSDGVNYYCTADLPYSTKLYGKTINLHVCVKESGVQVASPIIFGGY